MRYLIYARKSSESEEKQAQSIDDQLKELRGLALQRNLTVVGEFTEARSAKAPGGRPVFAEILARLQAGEADGILCWHVNRLFRNPVDFGSIAWMLQNGLLKEIYTPHQIHRSSDNVLLLSVENGMATQYIIDLKKAVLRGTNSKIEKGWFPHKAPEGYLNRDGEIIRDPLRFDPIRLIWEMALSDKTTNEILEAMTLLNYTTSRRKNTGGRKIGRSSLYRLLSNLFYTGYFVRCGETFKGAHEPMITLQEFFRVQKRFKENVRRRRTHDFAFNGMIRCGDCGCTVGGEYKYKTLVSGERREYTYYSCSNAKGGCKRRVIREEEIEAQIGALLERLTLNERIEAFGLRGIAEWKTEQNRLREVEIASITQGVGELNRKMDRLLDMRMNELLTDEEYLTQKKRLQESIVGATSGLEERNAETKALWEDYENLVTLLHYGSLYFQEGEPAVQNLIAQTIGATYILNNGSLTIHLSPVFSKALELKNEAENGSPNSKQDALGEERLVWLSILDVIRTHIRNGFRIPDIRNYDKLSWTQLTH